ncbi:MAG: hypothetical protein KA885_01095 [Spirochaetes bacterium]|nr:hypothetical protein [Spirochaetota bacterium]
MEGDISSSKLQSLILKILIIFFTSCSLSESDIINVTVNNSSNDDLVVSFVPSSKIEGISSIDDLNEKSVASSKILSKESKILYISKDKYYVYYNYADIWGALTEEGAPKVFDDLSEGVITINKQGWEYESN